jgi:ribosome maturation factor RimP
VPPDGSSAVRPFHMGRDVSRILAIAEPIAAERGLEILDIELAGRAVRVLLDSPDESRRVGIDDCQAVSQRLGDGLDAHDVLKDGYMLEVSSPGVNRPLKRIEHFRRVIGSKVRVRTRGGERRTWLGRLESVDDTSISVADDSGVRATIELADIDKANLEFEFDQGRPPAKKPGGAPAKKKRR